VGTNEECIKTIGEMTTHYAWNNNAHATGLCEVIQTGVEKSRKDPCYHGPLYYPLLIFLLACTCSVGNAAELFIVP
jgi:hypothetical protein